MAGYDPDDNGISARNLDAFVHSITGNLEMEMDADRKDWCEVVALVERNLIAWKAHYCDVWPESMPEHKRSNRC